MDQCWHDLFYVHTDMRISVKDPSRYVLVASADAQADDSREAILVTPRQECITYEYASGMHSFDVTDTASSVRKRFDELEKSVYHTTCFDVDMLPQPDGSIRLEATGDATLMRNEYDDTMAILTALTLTDRTGQTGRTEVFSRVLPSAPQPLHAIQYRTQGDREGFTLEGAVLYYMEGYAYLSIRYTDTQQADRMVLGCSDEPALNGLAVEPLHREYNELHYLHGYPEITEHAYEHLIFRLEALNPALEINDLTLTPYRDGQELPAIALVNQRVGAMAGPTVTPIPETPAPTEVSEPAPTPAPPADAPAIIPEDVPSLARYKLDVAEKPKKYSHYSANLFVTTEGYVLEPTFKYHDPLDEGVYLRLVSINGAAAESAGGTITQTSIAGQELLTARVCLAQVPAKRCTFVLEAVHPQSGEVLFTVSLKTQSAVRATAAPYNPNGSGNGRDLLDGVRGDPAPTIYHPFYNQYTNSGGWINDIDTSWIQDGMYIKTPNPYGGWGW